MYVLELTFGDDPRRLRLRAQHRERLRRLHQEGLLVIAGPWGDDSGAMLVFDVSGEAELRKLMDEDPYYASPGVTVSRIKAWTPIAGPASPD